MVASVLSLVVATILVAPVVSAAEPEPKPALAPEPQTARPPAPAPAEETYWEPMGSAAPAAPAGLTERDFYWAEIILADVGAVGLSLAINSQTHRTDAVELIGPYLLAGPIVHAVHGDFGPGVISLLIKAGIPLLGAFCGAALSNNTCSGDPGECADLRTPFIGFIAGMFAATALDAGLLTAMGTRPTPAATTVTPAISLSGSGGTMVGLAGTFF